MERKLYWNPDGSNYSEVSNTFEYPEGSNRWFNYPSVFGGVKHGYPDTINHFRRNFGIDPETGINYGANAYSDPRVAGQAAADRSPTLGRGYERPVGLELGMLADQADIERTVRSDGSLLRDREGEERAMREMQNEMLSFLPIGGAVKKVMVRTPWDSRILSGEKTMETATFGLPERFRNVPHVMQNESREGLGKVTFDGGRKVNSAEEFDSLYKQHLVPRASRFHYTQPEGKMPRKYLWDVGAVKKYKTPKKLKPFKGQFRFQEE
jgi:hypothetical protein